MTKVYTAQEMREFANYNDAAYARNPNLYSSAVSAALRQAADLMEREEKKPKKYEYAKKFANGEIFAIHLSDPIATKSILSGTKVVRRSVGEWEEVHDAD